MLTRIQAGNGQRTPPSFTLLHTAPNLTFREQILFIIGLTLIIGTTKTIAFFARKQKWKGTLAFVAGISLILMRWAFIGFIIELYGILVLFGDFLATIAGFVNNVPVVGPYIARALEAIGGARRNADLPV
jgi:hypothetical protein